MRYRGRTDHFLKASLTFSPACLRSPFDSSAWPSASRSASPVAWPAFFLILPLTSVTLLAALFSAPMKSFRLGARPSCPLKSAPNIRLAERTQTCFAASGHASLHQRMIAVSGLARQKPGQRSAAPEGAPEEGPGTYEGMTIPASDL